MTFSTPLAGRLVAARSVEYSIHAASWRGLPLEELSPSLAWLYSGFFILIHEDGVMSKR